MPCFALFPNAPLLITISASLIFVLLRKVAPFHGFRVSRRDMKSCFEKLRLFMVSGCPERDVKSCLEKLRLFMVSGVPEGHELLWWNSSLCTSGLQVVKLSCRFHSCSLLPVSRFAASMNSRFIVLGIYDLEVSFSRRAFFPALACIRPRGVAEMSPVIA